MNNRSADDAIEECIEIEALRLATATTPASRRKAWDTLQRLHRLRSARRVKEMEKERGLVQ